jgi:hypothetical protein
MSNTTKGGVQRLDLDQITLNGSAATCTGAEITGCVQREHGDSGGNQLRCGSFRKNCDSHNVFSELDCRCSF